MRDLLMAAVLISGLIYFAFLEPAESATLAGSASPTTFRCPDTVTTGILNVPQGWSPVVLPEALLLSFRELSVSREYGKETIQCSYSNDKTKAFSSYGLQRTMPPSFVCKKDSEGLGERSVTCVSRIPSKK